MGFRFPGCFDGYEGISIIGVKRGLPEVPSFSGKTPGHSAESGASGGARGRFDHKVHESFDG